jgi:beta-galactosidase
LCAAIDATSLHRLRRRVPVRLLVPRVERRLARLLHAFGPASPALLAVMGFSARDRALEDELDIGHSLSDAETLAQAFEQALDARGLPYAWCDGDDLEALCQGARWIVCATSGALSLELREALEAAIADGLRVSFGPHPVAYDAAMKPLGDVALAGAEQLPAENPAAIERAVARAAEELALEGLACDPDGVHATVYEDEEGALRVLFAINASERDVVGRIGVGIDARWQDALDGGSATSQGGVLEVRLLPWSVRMLARNP